ncbi:MAG: hypothetical protein EXS35_02655 [Pedosphaera sp.]|nr:hypothetical protein [Pedosphaera sp.]
MQPDNPPADWRRWAAALAGIYFVLVFPVLFLAHGMTDEAGDQQSYHEPFIVQLAADWPHVDLVNTHGLAMTPGYYLLMAAIKHYFSASILELRVVTALLGLPLILVVFRFCCQWTTAVTAFVLCLPFLLSSFVLGSSMWLRSDNVWLALVALALGTTAVHPASPARIFGLGIVTMLAISVRQICIWLLAPLALSSFLELFYARLSGSSASDPPGPRRSAGLILAMLFAVAAPMAVLWYFYRLWGGLLPPQVAQAHPVGNGFKIVPVILALTGFLGLFFAPAAWDGPLKNLLKDWRVWAASALALLVAVVPRTAGHQDPSGMLVELQKTPVAFDRILGLLPFAALAGGVVMILFLAAVRAGRTRAACFVLLGFASWSAAMTANVYVLRRHCEPFILLTLIWLTALGLPSGNNRKRFWIGMSALVAVQLVMLVVKIYRPAFFPH